MAKTLCITTHTQPFFSSLRNPFTDSDARLRASHLSSFQRCCGSLALVLLNVEIRSTADEDCEFTDADHDPVPYSDNSGSSHVQWYHAFHSALRRVHSMMARFSPRLPQRTSVGVLEPRGKPFTHFSGRKKGGADRVGLVQK